MDWSKGFTASYYATVVDPTIWSDISRINISGGSVNRTDTDVMETATLDCEYFDTMRELWIRVYVEAKQNDESYRAPVFTGILTAPNHSISDGHITTSIDCQSVLKPAKDVLLDRGWYIPSGTNSGNIIRTLLSVTPAPITIADGSPEIEANIVAEDGETRLSMVEKILDSINGWSLKINGNGEIEFSEDNDLSVVTFDELSNDSIEPEISFENNWHECPNVLRVVSGDLVAIVKDDDPDSPLSIPARGREIWETETNSTISSSDSLGLFARERLKEKQRATYKISYKRRFEPRVRLYDVVELNYPRYNISGLYMIESQTINLSYGISISESAVKI